MRIKFWALCVSLILTGPPIQAQEVTDLIPSDSGVALIVRNLPELRTKVKRFLGKDELNSIPRLSIVLQFYQTLNLESVVDETRPGGVVVVTDGNLDVNSINGFLEMLNLLVVVIPFKDAKSLAERFEIPQNTIREGEAITVNLGLIGQGTLMVKGNYFFFSKFKNLTKHAATSKRLSKILSQDQNSRLNKMDVVIQFRTKVWGRIWNDLLKEAKRALEATQDPREKQMAEKIVKAMNGIRLGICGLRLTPDGVSASLLSLWDGEQKEVGELLKLLRYDDMPTTLNELPRGNVIFAESAKGNGVANAIIARVLLKSTLNETLGVDAFISSEDRPLLTGVFNELWYNLKGNQFGVYQNANPKDQGQVTALAILHTEDGKKFYQHFANLADLAIRGEANADKINQWIKDLVNKDGRATDLAYLRLRLLGMRVAPALQAAILSENEQLANAASKLLAEIRSVEFENRFRTAWLKKIKTLDSYRQEKLIKDSLFYLLRPTFAVSEKTERYGKATGHILNMNLVTHDFGLARQLEILFGPKWREVHIVPFGKKVIVMIGSDTSLISKTIDRIEGKGESLTNGPMLEQFYKLSNDDRRAEMHLASRRLLMMTQSVIDNRTASEPPPLTSVGLSVGSDRLEVIIWVPFSEILR